MSASSSPETARQYSAWQRYRLFFSQFREHFHSTGAIAPSGGVLAAAITAPVAQAAAASRPLRVMEVGAGTGVFTRAILQHLRRGDRLDIFEINPAFQPVLESCIAASGARARGVECRLHITDICAAAPQPDRDCIVCGLPFNNFDPALVERILQQLLASLAPGGVLSYFEYLYIRRLKLALVRDRAERDRLRAVGAVVDRLLARHPHRATPVLRNLPPALARHISAA
jgi:phospholipid N-methyltransferase